MKHGRRAPRMTWLCAAGLTATALCTGCPSSPGGPADGGTMPPRGTLQLGAASAAVVESAGQVTVSVSRTGGSSGAVSVRLDTADGTALAGQDYTARTTTLTFADGEVGPKSVDIPVGNDTAAELTETFTVSLSAPGGGATLGSPASTTVSILDDDAPHGFGLNDTGLTTCSTTTARGIPCNSTDAGTDAFPRQDGENGRDATARDDTDGHAGFSFVKLDASGAPLPDQSVSYSTSPWACLGDRVTGLTWEVRTTDGGLRDRRWRYSWYSTVGLRRGAGNGLPNGGTCVDHTSCDTEKYVTAVNSARLCGNADWRLPTRSELLSIVDYGAESGPLLDLNFLADGSAGTWWSATTDWFGDAWAVDFGSGATSATRPGALLPVRLVRGGFSP